MESPKPPVLADQFLSWFCKGEFLEEIQGDLHEYYLRISAKDNTWRTAFTYWFHVLNFLRPYAIKKIKGQNLIYTTMLKANLIIAIRNLSKYRFYSGLNIAGLAMGLCCSLFILIWITDELSYDKFFTNYDRIYRVSSDLKFMDNKYDMAVSPAPMAEAFKSEFPEIVEAARIRNRGSSVFRKGERFIDQDNLLYADPDILKVFSFQFIHGDKSNALSEPNSVIITRSVAEKFFEVDNPVGMSLTNAADEQFKIDGVIEDIPSNSHFHPKVLISLVGDEGSRDGVWLSNNFHTYFLLNENNNAQALMDKFPTVYPKYFGPQLEQFVGATFDQMLESGSYVHYFLVPLGDIHLKSHQDIELEPNGDIQYVFMFGAIGVFILLIAIINFMNISTARAAIRGKEVGVRKVLGSLRRQLVNQFLTESVLFSFLALSLAIVLAFLVMPLFESLTAKQIGSPFSIDPALWIWIFTGVFGIGLLAGSYPAIVLSKFQPVLVLKGQMKSGKSAAYIRSVLVIFQFAMSVVLIVGTAVVYQQLEFVQNKNLGFDKEGVLILKNTFTLSNQIESFKKELLNNPKIEAVTITGYLPTNSWRSDTALQPKEANSAEDAVGCQVWGVDFDYVKTMGMEIFAGRDFSRDLATDSSAVLINETAAKRFGFDNPVGKKIKSLGDFLYFGKDEVTIIGVVEDFHFDSMRDNISPMVIIIDENNSMMAVRYASNDVKGVVNDVEDTWNKFSPNHALDYDFMDRQFDAKYEAEMKLGTIFTVFGVFAVLIACLGLFGLSSFTAEQRRKEIGIRKVLGASTGSLVGMLFRGYTKLLIIALVIGLPVAILLMNSWLEDFAYHTKIGPGVIVTSAVMAFVVAWLTVSYQSMKAARLNPAENLRTE